MPIKLQIWIITGIALALTLQFQYETLWILASLPIVSWSLIGIALLVTCVWRATRPEHRGTALKNICAIIVMGVMITPLAKIGHSLTEYIRFSWYRTSYDRIVSHIDQQPLTDGLDHDEDIDFILDPGPPRRVAFIWPGGLMDNWCGIVFDPTNDVLKINQQGLWSDEWRASYITKLFGGDMTSCRTISTPYYMCCFS